MLRRERPTHPAMLTYLNQAESTKPAPERGTAAELLELHTVGVGSYTEAMVQDAARLLTGWTVDMWETWATRVPRGRPLPGYRSRSRASRTRTLQGQRARG